jgi:hypothetical protein
MDVGSVEVCNWLFEMAMDALKRSDSRADGPGSTGPDREYLFGLIS